MSTAQIRKHVMLVMFIGFTVVFLSSSIKNTYQVFFVQMVEDFQQSRGGFAVAASVFMLVFGVASPIVGLISDRFGPKNTIIFGLFLSGFAFVGASLVDSFYAFVFFYGVMAAFGLTAMSFVPMGVLVDQSVSDKRKGLAYATLTNGAAIGFMVLSPVWVFTQGFLNWQLLYLLLGLLFMLPLLAMVLWYLPDDEVSSKTNQNQPHLGFSEKTKYIFSSKPFYALMFGFMGCGVTMAFIDVHMVAHFQDLNMTQTQISVALSVLGATELIGGFVAGWMCDRYNKKYVIAGFYLLRAISLFVLLLFPNFFGIVLFVVFFGLSYLGTVVGTSMYTLSLFGAQHKAFAFGFIWLVHQLGAFLSVQLGANAFDWSGDYGWTIAVTGVVAVMSFIVSLVLLPARPITMKIPEFNTVPGSS